MLFCHSSFQFTFVSTDFPMHNKGGCPYLPQVGVLSRCLSWWLLWRRISLSCCFGFFSTQPVISSTWFGFCSWQGFTTFDLYDLSHSRLPSWGSYYKSYGFTKKQLQSLLGKLSFLTACVKPGIIFMAQLLNSLRECKRPARHRHPISATLIGVQHF